MESSASRLRVLRRLSCPCNKRAITSPPEPPTNISTQNQITPSSKTPTPSIYMSTGGTPQAPQAPQTSTSHGSPSHPPWTSRPTPTGTDTPSATTRSSTKRPPTAAPPSCSASPRAPPGTAACGDATSTSAPAASTPGFSSFSPRPNRGVPGPGPTGWWMGTR